MSIRRKSEFTVEGLDKAMWASVLPHNYQPTYALLCHT
jgi:hypothetical protein